MNHRLLQFSALALALGLTLIPWDRAVGQEFFKGKSIRVVVGFSPGGGYDTYARAVARHMSKYIPGNPTFVVQNMTGAGSLVAANYTYNKAKPDGLTIGVWNSAFVLYQTLGDPAVKIDAPKLNWIGAPVKGSPHCSLMGFTGIKSLEDLLQSDKPIKVGATRAGSTYNDLPKILNQTIGTKFDVITGYPGTSLITIAMRKREVGGGCWGWESARVTARAMLDATGDDQLIPIVNHRRWEDPEVKNVPVTPEVIRKRGGAEALGIYNAWVGQYEFQRPWVLPPGVPEDRVKILRDAFDATFRDSEFLAEAKKSKLFLHHVPAKEVYRHIDRIMTISEKQKESLGFLVKKAK